MPNGYHGTTVKNLGSATFQAVIDANCIVVNKPYGAILQPGASIQFEPLTNNGSGGCGLDSNHDAYIQIAEPGVAIRQWVTMRYVMDIFQRRWGDLSQAHYIFEPSAGIECDTNIYPAVVATTNCFAQ